MISFFPLDYARLSPLGSMYVNSLGIGTWWHLYGVRLPAWMCSDGEAWMLVESVHFWTISCSFSLYVTCSLWKRRLFQNTLRCVPVSLTPTRGGRLPGLAAVSSWRQCSCVCVWITSLCPTIGMNFFLPLVLFFLLSLLLVWIVWSSITVLQITNLSFGGSVSVMYFIFSLEI